MGRLVVLVVTSSLLIEARALADAPQPAPPSASTRRPVIPKRTPPLTLRDLPDLAIATNSPTSWFGLEDGKKAFGVSLYVGLGDHHAVRANLARYAHQPLFFAPLLGDEGLYDGHKLDLGLSWVWYPRQLWRGFTIELGALRRARDLSEESMDYRDATASTTYSGRAMIGWTWLLGDALFVSLAAGVSTGYERGARTSGYTFEDDDETQRLARWQTDAEAYLRIGFAIDN